MQCVIIVSTQISLTKCILPKEGWTTVKQTVSRFLGRADNYARYRPRYPAALVDLLRTECGLSPSHTVADVGSGTGILTEMFLRYGNAVWAVEPNPEMRAVAERLLEGHPRFTSIDATAERTTLPDQSVDFVTAGQAFHWFELDRTRAEFSRILKPGGWAVLVWNVIRTTGTPFLEAFDAFSQKYIFAGRTTERPDIITPFFGEGGSQERVLENVLLYGYERLKGGVLSSSAAPQEGELLHEEMLHELAALFDAHQQDDKVTVTYDTHVIYGQLADAT